MCTTKTMLCGEKTHVPQLGGGGGGGGGYHNNNNNNNMCMTAEME